LPLSSYGEACLRPKDGQWHSLSAVRFRGASCASAEKTRRNCLTAGAPANCDKHHSLVGRHHIACGEHKEEVWRAEWSAAESRAGAPGNRS